MCFINKFISFYKILFFINKFICFCKIISFTKQIYENKSLSPNHVFTFKISRFTISIFLLIILSFSIKINDFLNKIGPIWTHRALYGPIGPLWAHKGPILFKKLIILIKNYKIINKNIKIVNLEILKVKTWFGDKDLFS